ncbi:ABC transporter ATP-binding protein [Lichenibacterium ramalinae]|uniref:sn-glycerol-3-phosphate ABC transporter ATP-binding protein UgpC n=1 Tax=Lichenibacterium ramalinae TaxID=2316527 RepID=A0A4Q2RFR5_9HYPH|nr:sn-glycerol-3-phosphate ABC transporter ATP-binding protein UgpC [Lichenibacterium ramalinae]RYB05235.1 sn-glycerol-3-phosphate ABC transporter ATP-binding protein UgpC [Lichenibacterium ramalinae]
MSRVDLEAVRKRFGALDVIHGVDLAIEDGSFCVFVGPSGCGKSTLLRMIAGLESVSGGTIRIGSRPVNDVEPAARGIGMVFQSYALYPHMTVRGNMGFGLRATGTSRAETERRLQRAAGILQLDSLLDRKPAQLSGGQRQRVAIGRAIMREPEVFLFDEPLSNLDAELRVQMRVEIAGLHRRLGNTMIYVTHDQTEAMTLADRIVVLRGGRVEQTGAPLELYDDPATAFVAGFIGSPRMNFLRGTAEPGGGVAFAGTRATVPWRSGPPAPGTPVQVGIRPEHLRDDGPVRLAVTVEVAEQLGGVSYLYGTTPGAERLVVERRGLAAARAGETVTVGLEPRDLRVFDGEGRRLR